MGIKRENWKGKYYVVRRSPSGKFIERRVWTRDFTLTDAVVSVKRRNSIYEDREVQTLTSVREVTRYGIVRTRQLSQVKASVSINGKIISASSRKTKKTLAQKQDEATENLYLRIAEDQTGTYDEDDGRRIIEERDLRINYQTVTYANI